MEEFLKIFGGSWVFDREENLKKCMEALKMPKADIEYVMTTKPNMTFEASGDKLFHRTEMTDDMVHELTYQLETEFVAKDETNDPPLFNNKVKVTFDGTKVKYVLVSQMTGPKKIDQVIVMYVKDGELISDTSPLKDNGEADTSIVGRRFYKKK